MSNLSDLSDESNNVLASTSPTKGVSRLGSPSALLSAQAETLFTSVATQPYTCICRTEVPDSFADIARWATRLCPCSFALTAYHQCCSEALPCAKRVKAPPTPSQVPQFRLCGAYIWCSMQVMPWQARVESCCPTGRRPAMQPAFLSPNLAARRSRKAYSKRAVCASSGPPVSPNDPREHQRPPQETPQTPAKHRIPSATRTATPAISTPDVLPYVRRSNLEIVAERFADTAYDVYLHYARLAGIRTDTGPDAIGTRRVVVLGSGWGAHALAKVLDVDRIGSLTIISPRNFFFFTPLLSSTAVGTTEFRSIVEPIRHANPLAEFFEAYATDIDLERHVVHCQSGKRDGVPDSSAPPFEVPYDVLVVACGETTSTFNVPGAREHAHFLKEIGDARRLRMSLLNALERATLPVWTDEERRRMLHFVVVGGGPTGCEFAGELADFITSDLTRRYGKKIVALVHVTLLQSGESLLTQFESSLQNIALSDFERGGVSVEFNARVVRVTDRAVVLRDGREIPYGVLVWAAGNATRPFVARLAAALDGGPLPNAAHTDNLARQRRKIPVDRWLRAVGPRADGRIFALGDCASLEEGIGPLPATAQVAGQQGAYVGRLLSRSELDGAVPMMDGKQRPASPFHFLSLGAMAYLGNERAILQLDATEENSLLVSGRIAFLLWRSVYAVKQVDIRNRVLVLFDWFKTRAFGRDGK